MAPDVPSLARNVRDVCLSPFFSPHATFPALRILRLSDPSASHSPEHKFAVGRGGHRVDASRNLWEGSGLKIDSTSTDVAWGHGGTFPQTLCLLHAACSFALPKLSATRS
jgi:hypothetical protein